MGLGGVQDAPLIVRDAPHKDVWGGGQIQEGKAMSSALLYPTVSPFHPSLSFPRGPSPCSSGTRDMCKGFKVPAGLLEDIVESRQGPLV